MAEPANQALQRTRHTAAAPLNAGRLAVVGALGTLSRYALGGLMQRLCGEQFPWGTPTVNGLGCFLFGLVWALAEERLMISGETRLIILTGFMGAFTPFSTFAFEIGEQLRDPEWLIAFGILGANMVLGVALLFLGIAAGRWLSGCEPCNFRPKPSCCGFSSVRATSTTVAPSTK